MTKFGQKGNFLPGCLRSIKVVQLFGVPGLFFCRLDSTTTQVKGGKPEFSTEVPLLFCERLHLGL